MRTLLVDNHDSYTFNLFQLIAEVNGVDPVVVTNDDPALATMPLDEFDNIVISPGPGRPQVPRDLGHVLALLDRTTLPVLGVCLGHQAIAHLSGAKVVFAPQPRHGHVTTVKHHGDPLFHGIPAEFHAVRYHSLCVEEELPDTLEATAWSEDGVVMALRHRVLPRWGVQFHPESVASEYGRDLLENFKALTAARLRVNWVELPYEVDTEAAFAALFADAPDCFWLDSSRVEHGLSRFSFLGAASEVLTYRVSADEVVVRDAAGEHTEPGTIFEVLEQRLAQRRVVTPALPFDLTGGYVGYFGYELGSGGSHEAATPDAAWLFADRLIAVDHLEGTTYVLTVHEGTPDDWVTDTAALLATVRPIEPPDFGAAQVNPAAHLARDGERYRSQVAECRRELQRGESYEICLTNSLSLPFDDDDLSFYRRLRRVNPAPYAAFLRVGDTAVFCSSPERFLRVERDGLVESKPIKGTAPRSPDPARDAELAAALANDTKTRAENLMIVDLLRNDLGQVCEIGSVRVDKYMAVESYETVHQLVSTIQGKLRPDVTPLECVRHCFPGGSMTGAPKKRTMEIIDRLEGAARGIYSGSLGFLGLSGGADLNIVIRTAVRVGDTLTIGAGGAIVLDSDPHDEYEEMLLKAMAPLRAWRRGREAA